MNLNYQSFVKQSLIWESYSFIYIIPKPKICYDEELKEHILLKVSSLLAVFFMRFLFNWFVPIVNAPNNGISSGFKGHLSHVLISSATFYRECNGFETAISTVKCFLPYTSLHICNSTASATDLGEPFLPSGVFFTLHFFSAFGITCFDQGFPWNRQFFFESCKTLHWDSKHQPGPSSSLNHTVFSKRYYSVGSIYVLRPCGILYQPLPSLNPLFNGYMHYKVPYSLGYRRSWWNLLCKPIFLLFNYP